MGGRLAAVGALALAAGAATAAAQDALQALDRDVRALVERCAPAVVRVTAERTAPLRVLSGTDEERTRIEEQLRRHAPRERVTTSGFLVDPGIVVTTAVVGEVPADSIRVAFTGGPVREATVLGVDEIAGVAVLRVEAVEGVKPLPLAEGRPPLGSVVVLLGRSRPLAPSMQLGLLSGAGKAVGLYDAFLVANVPVVPGDIGGPLLDVRGSVLGVAVTPREVFQGQGMTISPSPSGDPGAETLFPTMRERRYADHGSPATFVPAEEVRRIVAEIRERGRVRRGLLGVVLGGVEEVQVFAVAEGSPAARAGIRPRDRLASIDGTPVRSVAEAVSFIQRRAPGTKVRLDLSRGKQVEGVQERDDPVVGSRSPEPIEIEAELAEFTEEIAAKIQPAGYQRFNGLGVVPTSSGLVVSTVLPGSAAEAAGLRVGDRIVSVAGAPVSNEDDYKRAATGPSATQPSVQVVVSRGAEQVTLTLK